MQSRKVRRDDGSGPVPDVFVTLAQNGQLPCSLTFLVAHFNVGLVSDTFFAFERNQLFGSSGEYQFCPDFFDGNLVGS